MGYPAADTMSPAMYLDGVEKLYKCLPRQELDIVREACEYNKKSERQSAAGKILEEISASSLSLSERQITPISSIRIHVES